MIDNKNESVKDEGITIPNKPEYPVDNRDNYRKSSDAVTEVEAWLRDQPGVTSVDRAGSDLFFDIEGGGA